MNTFENRQLTEQEKLEKSLYEINESLRFLALELDRYTREYENPTGEGMQVSDIELDSGKNLSQIANDKIERTLRSIQDLAVKRRELQDKIIDSK